MKVKLLKRINKRFAYAYDYEKKEWVVTDAKQPFFFIKPLKDYSYAECMYGIMGGIGMVNHRRTINTMKKIFKEISDFTLIAGSIK